MVIVDFFVITKVHPQRGLSSFVTKVIFVPRKVVLVELRRWEDFLSEFHAFVVFHVVHTFVVEELVNPSHQTPTFVAGLFGLCGL